MIGNSKKLNITYASIFVGTLYFLTSVNVSIAMNDSFDAQFAFFLHNFTRTDIKDVFIDNELLNVFSQNNSRIKEDFMSRIKILHHPQVFAEIQCKISKASKKELAATVDRYRKFTKLLGICVLSAKNQYRISDLLYYAIISEIKYFDLLLTTALYHKENYKKSFLSAWTLSRSIGIGICIAALSYYGYTLYKSESNTKKKDASC